MKGADKRIIFPSMRSVPFVLDCLSWHNDLKTSLTAIKGTPLALCVILSWQYCFSNIKLLSEELSTVMTFLYTVQKWLFSSSGEIFSLMTGQACEFLLVKRLIAFHVPLESLLFVRIFSKNFFLESRIM